MLINSTRLTRISARLTAEQEALAKSYIQGAVHGFCNNCEGAFSVRKLFGGDNGNWNGTPLQEIYEWHFSKLGDHPVASEKAAIDVGRLLKTILNEDKQRTFKSRRGFTNEYLMVK